MHELKDSFIKKDEEIITKNKDSKKIKGNLSEEMLCKNQEIDQLNESITAKETDLLEEMNALKVASNTKEESTLKEIGTLHELIHNLRHDIKEKNSLIETQNSTASRQCIKKNCLKDKLKKAYNDYQF